MHKYQLHSLSRSGRVLHCIKDAVTHLQQKNPKFKRGANDSPHARHEICMRRWDVLGIALEHDTYEVIGLFLYRLLWNRLHTLTNHSDKTHT